MGPFFFSPRHGHATCRQPVAFAYLLDRLSLCLLHSSHDVSGIADQTVKTYIATVAGEAAPYPPPSDPLLATPDRSRILLPRRRSTGLAHILLPCAGPKLAIWLRPYHQAPTSVGASFLSSETGHLGRRPNTPDRGRPSARDNPPGVPNPQRICMAALPIARLCRGERRWIKASTAAFVVTRPSKVSG